MCDRTFRPYDLEQPFLLPPTLQEWLPAEHLVYFISDLVEALIVDPKIQTTSLVRFGSGLKGGRDGENTGQA